MNEITPSMLSAGEKKLPIGLYETRAKLDSAASTDAADACLHSMRECQTDTVEYARWMAQTLMTERVSRKSARIRRRRIFREYTAAMALVGASAAHMHNSWMQRRYGTDGADSGGVGTGSVIGCFEKTAYHVVRRGLACSDPASLSLGGEKSPSSYTTRAPKSFLSKFPVNVPPTNALRASATRLHRLPPTRVPTVEAT